uniref:Uncharacterized protein n=1 Tax=Arundo donax TaxID=35708 RepID=A0A0A8ZXZ5_ARUDO
MYCLHHFRNRSVPFFHDRTVHTNFDDVARCRLEKLCSFRI